VSLKGIELANMRVADHRGPIDGWRLCGGQIESDSKAPLYIWRTLPELLCIRMFNERALTSSEQETLRIATIEHETTKELRFASRAFMERWQGIEGTPYAAALQTTCPCASLILPATGERADPLSHGEVCGKTRYCLGCERLVAMMSALPSMHVLCPLVASVLGVGMRDWRSGSVEAWILRNLSAHAFLSDTNSARIAQARH
jgi:hypothetical protein